MKEQTQEVSTVETEFKPFNQVPEWKENDDFVVKGSEFEQIYNYFNVVMPAVSALQTVFERAIKSGTVKIKHEYTDGSGEVPREELEKFYTRFQEEVQKNTEKELTTKA